MKEHLHEERNYSLRVKTVEEDTGSQDQKSKSQALRKMTYLNHSDDPKDHLKIFQAAAKVEWWAILTWFHMFNSTLTGSARKCIKVRVKIHHIKQRFKAESMHVKGAPECMRISGFMHEITYPELIKRLYDNISKSVDEMMRVTTTFLRGEVATSNQLKQDSKKDQPKAAKNGETSGKDKPLAILMVKPWQRISRWKITQSFSPNLEILFPPIGDEDEAEGPMIIEAEIGGHSIHRIYIDGGSTLEILYEHCLNRLRPEVKNQMVLATAPLIGFSGEIIWTMGQILLPIKIGDAEHFTSTWMNFVVLRSPSLYNGIIGRPGVRKIQVVPSTAYKMLKLLILGGILTLWSIRIIPLKCTMISGVEALHSNVIRAMNKRIKVAIHSEYPEQTIIIISTLTEEGWKVLYELLRRNLDIFAWKPKDITGVP
ncbi:hypothetical protein Tco_1259857 [Tanacetum coccineum]